MQLFLELSEELAKRRRVDPKGTLTSRVEPSLEAGQGCFRGNQIEMRLKTPKGRMEATIP